MMRKIIYLLLFFLAMSLRLIRLDLAPSSLSNDEISIAYDSYSILHTQKDEHGIFLPLSFKSHSTYKAPMAGYLGVITNYFFGNSEFSARFNSAFLGSLTVILLGLLVSSLTAKSRPGYVASFILALTPSHIHTSRMILESNIALFFVVLGLVLFIKYIDINKWWLLPTSSLVFGLSAYSYHAEWLLIPMLTICLFVIFRKVIPPKKWLLFFGLLILVCLPVFTDFIGKLGTTARANTEMFYNDIGTATLLSDPTISVPIKTARVTRSLVDSYINQLNFRYIFYDGLNILTPEYLFLPGLISMVWLPFLIIGFSEAFSRRSTNKKYLFLIWLLILSLAVPALTRGGYNLVRYLHILVPLVIFIALGVDKISQNKQWKTIRVVTGLLVVVQFFYFLVDYFVLFPKVNAIGYQYGYRQIADYINLHGNSYKTIVVHDRFGPGDLYVGVPHLYISYFAKVDPVLVQARKQQENGLAIGKYIFKSIDWRKEVIAPNRLYFVSTWNQPSTTLTSLKITGEIVYPDGNPFYVIYESVK